jgi:predicted small secreted protein
MKVHLILPVAMALLLLSGCNTIKGVGEDISGSANWTQEKMSGIGGGESSTKASDSQYVKNPPEFPKAN